MAWFVVQEKGKRAQMIIDRKLLDVVYGAPTEVTVRGFRSYETAKCATMIANAELEVAEERAAKRTDHAAALKAHAACWMEARARDLARK